MDKILKSKRALEPIDTIATIVTHKSAWRKTMTVQHTQDAEGHPMRDLLITTNLVDVLTEVK
jgi:hypothetical protein